MAKALTIGKLRGLQQLMNPRGIFTLLALDSRESLRRALSPSAPSSVAPGTLTEFKVLLTRVLAPYASGVLLDPVYGAAQALGLGVLPGGAGLAVSLEASGFTGEPGARRTALAAGWDVGKAKRMGASAAKLLVYYHPEAATTPQQEAIAEAVGRQCEAYDLPLLLAPWSYGLNPIVPKGSAEFARQQPYVVQDSARHLAPLGADVLLAEFPANLHFYNHLEALDHCQRLSETIEIPWVLISSGTDYELYRQEVEIACRGGASGFMVGCALWQEITALPQERWEEFAATTLTNRLQTLSNVANAEAPAYQPQIQVPEDWLQTYAWQPEPALEALAD